MSGARVDFRFAVYMNKRDLSPWVKSVSVEVSPDVVETKATVDFTGWSDVVAGATWDVFGSYSPTAVPRAEPLITDGVVPQDRTERVQIRKGSAPTFRVVVYSRAWEVQRRRPRRTIVLVPAVGPDAIASARTALANYDGPVGSVSHWVGVRTMRAAVNKLARSAGVNADVRLPDYPLAPMVVGPHETYWSAIASLVNPFRPQVNFDESTNTLQITDPTGPLMGAESPIALPADILEDLSIRPSNRRRPARVIVVVPRWG